MMLLLQSIDNRRASYLLAQHTVVARERLDQRNPHAVESAASQIIRDQTILQQQARSIRSRILWKKHGKTKEGVYR